MFEKTLQNIQLEIAREHFSEAKSFYKLGDRSRAIKKNLVAWRHFKLSQLQISYFYHRDLRNKEKRNQE